MKYVRNSLHNVQVTERNASPSLLVPRQLLSPVVESVLMVYVDGCLLENVKYLELVQM